MRGKLIILGVSLLLALAVGYALRSPDWPPLKPALSAEPQAVINVDRDFAYHIGDVVPVDIFVLQNAGTTVDPKTLAIDGDFELVDEARNSEKSNPDGSTTLRLHLNLQSFQVKPALSFKGSMGWNRGDERLQIALPELVLHTSNTWDGRKMLKEGDDPRVPVFWYFGRYVLALAISSLTYLTLTALAIRNWWRSRPRRPVDTARILVEQTLAKLRAEPISQQEYLALDGIIRDKFAIGPVPAEQLQHKNRDLVEFLKANQRTIYAREPASEEDRACMVALVQQLLRHW